MKSHSEVLKKAFIQADVEDYNNEIRKNFEWIPSPAFEKRMKKLIHHRTNPLWEYINTTGKKVAAVALAVIIILGSMMSVKAIREPVWKFIIEIT